MRRIFVFIVAAFVSFGARADAASTAGLLGRLYGGILTCSFSERLARIPAPDDVKDKYVRIYKNKYPSSSAKTFDEVVKELKIKVPCPGAQPEAAVPPPKPPVPPSPVPAEDGAESDNEQKIEIREEGKKSDETKDEEQESDGNNNGENVKTGNEERVPDKTDEANDSDRFFSDFCRTVYGFLTRDKGKCWEYKDFSNYGKYKVTHLEEYTDYARWHVFYKEGSDDYYMDNDNSSTGCGRIVEGFKAEYERNKTLCDGASSDEDGTTNNGAGGDNPPSSETDKAEKNDRDEFVLGFCQAVFDKIKSLSDSSDPSECKDLAVIENYTVIRLEYLIGVYWDVVYENRDIGISNHNCNVIISGFDVKLDRNRTLCDEKANRDEDETPPEPKPEPKTPPESGSAYSMDICNGLREELVNGNRSFNEWVDKAVEWCNKAQFVTVTMTKETILKLIVEEGRSKSGDDALLWLDDVSGRTCPSTDDCADENGECRRVIDSLRKYNEFNKAQKEFVSDGMNGGKIIGLCIRMALEASGVKLDKEDGQETPSENGQEKPVTEQSEYSKIYNKLRGYLKQSKAAYDGWVAGMVNQCNTAGVKGWNAKDNIVGQITSIAGSRGIGDGSGLMFVIKEEEEKSKGNGAYKDDEYKYRFYPKIDDPDNDCEDENGDCQKVIRTLHKCGKANEALVDFLKTFQNRNDIVRICQDAALAEGKEARRKAEEEANEKAKKAKCDGYKDLIAGAYTRGAYLDGSIDDEQTAKIWVNGGGSVKSASVKFAEAAECDSSVMDAWRRLFLKIKEEYNDAREYDVGRDWGSAFLSLLGFGGGSALDRDGLWKKVCPGKVYLCKMKSVKKISTLDVEAHAVCRNISGVTCERRNYSCIPGAGKFGGVNLSKEVVNLCCEYAKASVYQRELCGIQQIKDGCSVCNGKK